MIKSAGNDIIDLRIINIERTKDARFYTKFITGTEIALYSQPQLASLPFECFVWMLWSVKESIYKFMQRHNSNLIFSPSKIVVQQISAPADLKRSKTPAITEAKGFEKQACYCSTVTFGQDTFYSRSIIDPNSIFTAINNADDFENVYYGVEQVEHNEPEFQSKAVRQFILKRLGHILNMEPLRIIKNTSGCPVLYNDAGEINIPVSLTHHGYYVAYTFFFEG
ncbi:4'-phosphopantetheinyl transferase family protein [Mucilaginibacter sp. FT3.2]|uniref:4'-phosphopantetheinyl transferase family protein n=1 Tax=Mucilaginibacter sp. FT3.2 TaxID=2723090 RepID=UPI00160A3B08|nr:4'-phosphopantetheinyl transferase superfamily protein [Mucilaginibacter sp. FT3.2]MBB6232666.1 phosphopantetheinyl transferase (holo-ACP synthase) [Mucilaginibacter sp. FT3.2]